ncbi:MAG: hypothetical protein J4F38_11695 [Pseudomonadales bacterium]|nr:hypothetical protein [Pseudomonadales bacterium]
MIGLRLVVGAIMRNLAVVLLFLGVGSTAIAEEETTSAHVFQAIAQLGADVDLVREVMGRPESTTDPWIVIEAESRHVFYQALTLLRKANRLALEVTEEQRAGLLPAAEGEIEPALVLDVINRARVQIDAVRSEFGITYRAEPPELEADRSSADVLREIVQVSRQLNFLIDRKFRPADVYGRLVLAATYVAGALTVDETVPDYGELPPFESGKVPADVYRRVLECLELATVIGDKRGVDVLKLNLRRELRRRDIGPADVYDLATTLLSEVAYLTLVIDAKDVDAPPIERPKHIFPSHVYQIAGMLQDELARLEGRM